MYDTVYFNCPRCDNQVSTQSKAGDCTLRAIYQRSVPIEIAIDIQHDKIHCSNCEKTWTPIMSTTPDTVPMYLIEKDD